ncbi:MAG: uracil-DNA glycosylase family protein, partial [Parvularculaceae bacterium]
DKPELRYKVAREELRALGCETTLENLARCARLVAFRRDTESEHADWFNGAVASFGDPAARLLIVGLAPGLKGANRTGRPFTGDFAGDLLYTTLLKFGFAKGRYGARIDDGLTLSGAMITNAVRCVPPQNKPTTAEIAECRPFLAARINALPALEVIICLGRIAHESTLTALGIKRKAAPFAHGARHDTGPDANRSLALFDSYHCSRYNTNTGRLTTAMFESVFREARAVIGGT